MDGHASKIIATSHKAYLNLIVSPNVAIMVQFCDPCASINVVKEMGMSFYVSQTTHYVKDSNLQSEIHMVSMSNPPLNHEYLLYSWPSHTYGLQAGEGN
jgi:hypothetical protein